MLEIASQQRGILFRMLLRSIFKGQTLHHADTPLAKSIRAVDWHPGEV
jgi:hypothetical protein